MSEMPLVFFTVLSQMAAGAFITLYLIDRKNGPASKTARCIAGVMALSLLMSTAHLGRPELGYRALANLGSSWLSREILLSSLFFFVSLVYCLPQAKRAGGFLGFVGSILAALFIVVTSMVYTLPSYPAWNGAAPAVFFILTAATAGPLLALAVLGGQALEKTLKNAVLAALLLNAVWFMAFAAEMDQYISISLPDACLRVAVGALVPIALLSKCQTKYADYLPIIWGFVLAGELFGRILFYAGTNPAPMFGL